MSLVLSTLCRMISARKVCLSACEVPHWPSERSHPFLRDARQEFHTGKPGATCAHQEGCHRECYTTLAQRALLSGQQIFLLSRHHKESIVGLCIASSVVDGRRLPSRCSRAAGIGSGTVRFGGGSHEEPMPWPLHRSYSTSLGAKEGSPATLHESRNAIEPSNRNSNESKARGVSEKPNEDSFFSLRCYWL